jgi:hypothetical protein
LPYFILTLPPVNDAELWISSKLIFDGTPFGQGYLLYLFSEKDAAAIPDAFDQCNGTFDMLQDRQRNVFKSASAFPLRITTLHCITPGNALRYAKVALV